MLNCLSVKLSLITLVAASAVNSYSYQVVIAQFSTITELGQEEHPINIPKKTEGKEENVSIKVNRSEERKKKGKRNKQSRSSRLLASYH